MNNLEMPLKSAEIPVIESTLMNWSEQVVLVTGNWIVREEIVEIMLRQYHIRCCLRPPAESIRSKHPDSF